MSNNDKLLRLLGVVTAEVDSSVLHAVADALDHLSYSGDTITRLSISDLAPNPASRDSLRQLLKLWVDAYPEVASASLAWAIRSACAANEYHRSSESLELVWTGPSHPTTHFRRTDQALYELIQEARKSILLTTFAAYKTPELDKALIAAVSRSVHVQMVVESSEISEGKILFGAFEGLRASIIDNASIYVWPMDKRPTDKHGKCGSLHAKCAVADQDTAFISSANLTGYALSLNMEMGILIKGGELPGQISNHFKSLVEEGILVAPSSKPS